MKSYWTPTLTWIVAVIAALLFAFAAPSESSVMGRVPSVTAKRLDQRPLVLPEGLPAVRTLALVAFNRGHRQEIDSWIKGLELHNDRSITWLRMPVLDDPGTDRGRSAIESRLLARHTGDTDRARLVPVFTNREEFVRAAGLSGSDHAGVLVIGRDGQVLARAEGLFDEDKAQALRETLKAQAL